jgi:hypothetical protein
MNDEVQTAADKPANSPNFEAPHPGSSAMPRWTEGELIEAPRITWRSSLALIGPGLVMSASAIGGGEWLLGPEVTAKYGGQLLWLAAFSILFQALYNIEISRYTLYCGEPIFSGKFRTLPGPWFWLVLYLLFDFSTVFPYLAASAVVPVEVLILGGQMPDHDHVAYHWWLNKVLSTGIFLLALVPLIFGGKIFNSLKVVMSAKLVLVFGFLIVLGLFYSRPAAWGEIWSGFFKIGNVPALARDADGKRAAEQPKIPKVENIFVELTQRGRLPLLDFSLVASIAALAAIAGNGGLSNTPVSNYARDQGWGMGDKVGAIPSIVGGRGIALTHTGCVFEPNDKALPRWRRWYWHLVRDQLLIWGPACLIGMALPSLLSVEFLPRGTGTNGWNAAVMTAGGVREHVTSPPPGTLVHEAGLTSVLAGPTWGQIFWALTLLCGFLVLSTTLVSTIDGIIRRWVDVFWISSRRLREVDPRNIKYVYFGVLIGYSLFGIVMLWFFNPQELIRWATLGYNFAIGFSCWHTLVLNRVLLPKPLRPGLVPTISLITGGIFFWILGIVTLLEKLRSVGLIEL